uniref:D-lactate dehydrogenase (cytochrome) n=1 Tax=Romanomermis culicivorax TaxID=13658 RepID=A0A915KIX4_ROMCU
MNIIFHYFRLGKPEIVVKAESVDDVSKVVSFCNQRKMPVIAFGGGTGLEGGVSAIKGGVSLDLSALDQIVVVNAEDFDCTVQCGVTRVQLNTYLKDTGLFFPVDPGADATLGGMCATSASGTNAVRYGTMRENVLNLQVVLANGDIIYTRGEGRHVRKSAAGYNLTNLFVGSEGTLGIITAATLKLYGIPECISVAVVPFSTVRSAVDAVVQILQNCIPVSRIEFLDEAQITACNKYSKLNLKVTPTLFLEFHGSLSTMEPHIELTKDICSTLNGQDCEFNWASSKEERDNLWVARHNAYYACLALK